MFAKFVIIMLDYNEVSFVSFHPFMLLEYQIKGLVELGLEGISNLILCVP